MNLDFKAHGMRSVVEGMEDIYQQGITPAEFEIIVWTETRDGKQVFPVQDFFKVESDISKKNNIVVLSLRTKDPALTSSKIESIVALCFALHNSL